MTIHSPRDLQMLTSPVADLEMANSSASWNCGG
ncbi:hypothetical protein FBY39_1586 [Microbacterium sp. SLBN-146]|nr:hypothetical protein FBY39_1586 [Microbacterium sp. SLBN-146]